MEISAALWAVRLGKDFTLLLFLTVEEGSNTVKVRWKSLLYIIESFLGNL